MTEHPGIDKISFTGSVPTGKKVLAGASSNLKRVTLELGGNDAAIVLDDVDPKAIAPQLFRAAFANCGQICVAIKRLYVPESIYEPMCEALAEIARSVKLGDGLDPESQMGPLQNKMQYEKCWASWKTPESGRTNSVRRPRARSPGLFHRAGDRRGYRGRHAAGRRRTVRTGAPGDQVPRLDDAIRRANDTRYGLSGSVWTNDLERGAEVAARLEVGTAYVNQHHIPDRPCRSAGPRSRAWDEDPRRWASRATWKPRSSAWRRSGSSW